MKTNPNPEDESLRTLLRSARPEPALPPRFQEKVWSRIEAEEQLSTPAAPHWLAALANYFLKPKFAVAFALVVALAGIGFGWTTAEQQSRQSAQARYLAAVAPNSLH